MQSMSWGGRGDAEGKTEEPGGGRGRSWIHFNNMLMMLPMLSYQHSEVILNRSGTFERNALEGGVNRKMFRINVKDMLENNYRDPREG